ncbi:sarcosine oxidase subunit delta [Marinobacterium sediminicola]|uniref:Sarcosine oxidase subunit delta n=1 Tax=Marinobacterium sediminicola TaxID=518898 RepID=A0ABY1S246_9GAMM|nr:sarcosine oxidase subunit delta [Marinobacterium sediminicola]ULG69440.1 sarcosine oxidase subunit delta [Marinobacterium sediminicola]SMR75590.1 sarcosine oxidase subunit delta [Marinobacterium sediminicola]
MKVFDCPVIGRRPISEFDYVGEVRKPPMDADEASWAAYVFNRQGAPGLLREWWYHRPTGRWYVMERDTLKDEVVRFIDLEEVRYDIPA